MKLSQLGQKIASKSGIGVLMDDLGEATTNRADTIMLGGGNPARIPEVECQFRLQMEQFLADNRLFEQTVGQYDAPQGNPEFRKAVGELLREQYGWSVTADHVAVTNGSQSAFFMLFNLFAGRCEEGLNRKILLPLTPEYIGYSDLGLSQDLFVSARPQIHHLEDNLFKYQVDFDAIRPSKEIGAICVSRPTNPTGNVLTDEEIRRLRQIAAQQEIPLIIDSAYGGPFPLIQFSDGNPIWNEHVVLCLSVSKLGLPGIRTGLVIARPEIIRLIAEMNAVLHLAPGSIGPAMLLSMVQSRRILHLSREVIRPFYQNKAQDTLDTLRKELKGIEFFVHKPEGAFFVWIWFPHLRITDEQLYQRLKQRGVLIVPGHYFFPGFAEVWPHRHQCIRLTYSQDQTAVHRGIEILAREVRQADGS